MCNGSTPDSDSVCGGSNPSSPANRRRLVLRRFFYFARRIHAFLRRNGAGYLQQPIFSAPTVQNASGGPFFSVLPEKRMFQPRFLSHMRKKAPLTVERKNSQGGFASEQTPHPSSCPPLAADRPRPFRCSSFSHTNRFAGFAWEPCPLDNPP